MHASRSELAAYAIIIPDAIGKASREIAALEAWLERLLDRSLAE